MTKAYTYIFPENFKEKLKFLISGKRDDPVGEEYYDNRRHTG
jgi:hypothetical protein